MCAFVQLSFFVKHIFHNKELPRGDTRANKFIINWNFWRQLFLNTGMLLNRLDCSWCQGRHCYGRRRLRSQQRQWSRRQGRWTVSGILNCAVSGMDCAKGVDGGSGMKSPIFSVRLAKAAESMLQRSSFLWNWKLKMTLVNQSNTLSALDILYGRTFTDGSTSNFNTASWMPNSNTLLRVPKCLVFFCFFF